MKLETWDSIIRLAEQADILIFGEVHGTQEVPQLAGDSLEKLRSLGYGALGLEIPHSEQEPLRRWALGEVQEQPPFFAHPWGDGRGNEQVLMLVQKAVQLNWQVLCFDTDAALNWQERDRGMAENLLAEWERTCPDKKVLCICGNLHSRLSPFPQAGDGFWPSFAANLQILRPGLIIRSLNITFHEGQFFNLRLQRFQGQPIDEAYIVDGTNDQHSLTLHLPRATPVTHTGKVTRLPMRTQLLLFIQAVKAGWMNRLKPK